VPPVNLPKLARPSTTLAAAKSATPLVSRSFPSWRHPSQGVRARGRELHEDGLWDQPGVAPLLALQVALAQRTLDDPELHTEAARDLRCGERVAHAPRWKGHSVSPPPQLEGGWSGSACAVGPARAYVRRAAISPRALSSRVYRIPW
jgi:hypothetical protein